MTTEHAPSGYMATRGARRRRRRRDVGRVLAQIVCVALSILALVPVGLAAGLRSAAVRTWAESKIADVAREQNITGSWKVNVSFLPLAFVLTDVRIDSSDGGAPALTARRVAVKPKLFGLLSGKIGIDQIDIDTPHVRAVVQGGELKNLAVKMPEKKKSSGPFHAPFRSISVTDGAFDVTLDDAHFGAQGLDLDVAAQDDPRAGSSFEVSTWMAGATVDRKRTAVDGKEALDEDVLCRLEGRVRIDPDAVTVHRLSLSAAVDLDDAAGTRPSCKLDDGDRRKIEASMAHLRVRFPKTEDAFPQISGRVRVRAPIALAGRFTKMPDNDGWVGADLELRFVDGMRLPEVDGKIEGHDLRITHYNVGRNVEGEIRTRADVVESPRLKLSIGDATVTLTDVRAEPLVKGIPVRAGIDIQGLNFTSLMRDLGVHPHAHVQWDVREAHVPLFAGTIVPLKLDGDLSARSENFAVYDAPADGPKKSRMIGLSSAQVTTHVAVRPDAVNFLRSRVVAPKSVVENGSITLQYNEILHIEVPTAKIDLGDLTPLGNVPVSGQAEASVSVTGAFGDPKLEGDAAIKNFSLGDIPFGDVTAAHVKFRDMNVELSNVKAQKGKSRYEMPSGSVDFGGRANLALDGVVTSPSFDIRDFLALWHMEDDPRFTEITGVFSTRSNVHVALGGPQDKCGAGFIDVDAHAKVSDVDLFGEHFDDGELDLDYEWTDRLAGLYGANVEVHSFNLRKLRKTGQGGSLLGSASIDKGALRGNVVVQSIPLSKVQTLGKIGQKLEATASGFARITGTVDEYAVEGDLDVSPALVRGTRFGPSQLHFRMSEVPAEKGKITGRTRCGGPIGAPFDKEAYARNKAPHGEMRATGQLFGNQVRIDELVMTRAEDPAFKASLDLEKFDLGAAARLLEDPDTKSADAEPTAPLDGVLSGTLTLDKLKKSDYSHAVIEFAPRELSVQQGGQKLALKSQGLHLAVKDDAIALPPMDFELRTANGFSGNVTVSGGATKLTRSPELDIRAALAPIDLGVLAGTVPRVTRAQGTLAGAVHVTGKALSPTVDGRVTVKGGDFAIQGLPGAITNVDVDVEADASEVRIVRGTGRFSGGTLSLTGRMPLHGFALGAGELDIAARGVRFAPDDGMRLAADADLTLTLAAPDPSGQRSKLPHLAGDVTITSFEYTRPMALTGSLGEFKAKRATVDSYDPSLDSLTLDVNVRAKNPLRIHNNMIEAQLIVESDVLQVTGTNQRIGLRGELKSLPGGRFHFRTSDFDVQQAILRFEDPTRIAPNVDVVAVTEYRRMGDSANVATGLGRQAGLWRITLHAYGETDNLHLDMTSDPPLSQEDIVLLLTIGMTRAEVDQLQAGALGAGAALEAIAAASGAEGAVKKAVPVIDDFRFGSAYSSRTGRTEPQVTLGKRITDNVRANVTTSLAEDRELRSNVEWRLNQRWSVQGSYDNINDVTSSTVGNVGVDIRWRVEFR